MKEARQLIGGILLALLSLGLLIGSFNLAIVETGPRLALGTTPTPAASQLPQATPRTLAAGQTPPTALITVTILPPPTSACPFPTGWQTITVQTGTTLAELATLYQTTTEILLQANCLDVETLIPGSTVYVPQLPPTPTLVNTPIPTRCGPPVGWVQYTVQAGDTLFKISQAVGSSVWELKLANCLQGNTIYVNQRLYVPHLPPTREPTRLPTQPVTPLPTDSPTIPPSPTSTATPPPSSTETPTPTIAIPPSDTSSPTPTATPTDTLTPSPTSTPTPEPSATATPPPPTTTPSATP